MRIVFFGSDDFAAAHLECLLGHKVELVGCVTQPDRPKGRGMRMAVSPIKALAVDHNVPVLQPADLKEPGFLRGLADLKADLFVVIAYGRLLPQVVLDMPAYSAINVHPSLLPNYRGAAPINWAIINGDRMTGISIIRLNVRMDAGDIIARVDVAIQPEDNAVTLRARMIRAGQELLLNTIDHIKNQTIVAEPQDPGRVSLAPKLTKELGRVCWSGQTAGQIHNLARGLMPWPTAYTTFQGKTIKLLATSVLTDSHPGAVPGQIVRVDKSGITVAARAGAVTVHQLLPESSKPMSADEFVRGYHVRTGQKLGE